VDTCGELIRSSPTDPTKPVSGPAWEGTLFAAAVDAATGVLWSNSDPHDPTKPQVAARAEGSKHRRTQGRHLSLAAELIGVAPQLDTRTREAIAQALAVPALELHQAARDLDCATLYRDEGRIITSVLAQLRPARSLGDQLHAAGEIVGLWGPPRRWDPGGFEIPRPFRRSSAPL
jgi:hypothetical protein